MYCVFKNLTRLNLVRSAANFRELTQIRIRVIRGKKNAYIFKEILLATISAN